MMNCLIVRYLKGNETLEGPNPAPMVDIWRVLHPDAANCGTISRFAGSMDPVKIDYILCPPETEVLVADILRHHADGGYPSDHYPVVAKLRFK